jgi:hypothetical protein
MELLQEKCAAPTDLGIGQQQFPDFM